MPEPTNLKNVGVRVWLDSMVLSASAGRCNNYTLCQQKAAFSIKADQAAYIWLYVLLFSNI